MQEVRNILLVDCIVSITQRAVGIKGDEFIFVDTHDKVSKAVLDEATVLQTTINEQYRIEDINKKAGEIIEAKYPITKQLNYPRGSNGSLFVTGNVTVNEMYSWIDNVRDKSNLAIANGLTLQEFIDSITE
ncbi:hypothetical protein [Aliarcobacter butzleri]|uniref:hypothetical protein n=1 Tax=Aliarcobacter butzleri TaxID=28197 RepID=UPI0021B64C43|nr:hypothetical protein [Aliarcobacter butzleri]MCT7643838.1 hypothetical protein [Aliarcobacter butzleri]